MLTFTRLGPAEAAGSPPSALVAARVDSTGRSVELRLLSGSLDDAAWLARADDAATRAAGVRSAYVAQVIGLGTVDGMPALAFEPVFGPSLAELMQRHGPYSWSEVRALLAQMAAGLASIQAAGLLHGNLSAATVRVPVDGLVKLTDPGLESSIAPAAPANGGLALMSRPPEGLLDGRSDLYSLGVLVLQMLTGSSVPTPRDPRLNAMPYDAQVLVRSLVAASPDYRPASAQALVDSLHQQTTWLPAGPARAFASPGALASGGPSASAAVSEEQRAAIAARRARSTRPTWPRLLNVGIFVFGFLFALTNFLRPAAQPTVYFPPIDAPSFDQGGVPIEPLMPGGNGTVFSELMADLSVGFEGTVYGSVTTGGTGPATFKGSIRVFGDDSALSLGPDLRDPIMPPYSEVVRSGDAVYLRSRQSGQWIKTDRPIDRSTDSLISAFLSIGWVTSEGMCLTIVGDYACYSAVLPATYDALWGYGAGDLWGAGPIQVQILVDDNTQSVGGFQLSFEYGYGDSGSAQIDHRTMLLQVVFDRVGGVRVAAPDGPFATPTPVSVGTSVRA